MTWVCFTRVSNPTHIEFNESFNDLAEFHQPAFHQLKAEESSSSGKLKAFQQININGKETTGLSVHAFQPIANEMLVALEMREKYIQASCQEFHPTVQRHIRLSRAKPEMSKPKEENVLSDDIPYHPPRGVFDLDPFFDLNVESLPEQLDHTWCMSQGIISLRGKEYHKALFNIFLDENDEKLEYVKMPDTSEFIKNHSKLLLMCSDGTLRTYCWRRLQFLSHKFHLHSLLNENVENREQKELPHRDFYNCRKIDNHIHAAACMNQKHLLR